MEKIIQLISSILLAFFLFSCNSAKKIEKKDQQAVWRVKANINLLNDVGNEWQKLNPCYPDTIRIGKVITVIDSSYAKENIDRLNDAIASILENYPVTQNIDSLKTAIRKQVEKECKPRTIDNSRVDTLPRDKRFENSLKDRVEFLNNQVSNLQGQNAQLKTENGAQKKELNKTRWWGIGASVFLLLLIAGLVYLLFKK